MTCANSQRNKDNQTAPAICGAPMLVSDRAEQKGWVLNPFQPTTPFIFVNEIEVNSVT